MPMRGEVRFRHSWLSCAQRNLYRLADFSRQALIRLAE